MTRLRTRNTPEPDGSKDSLASSRVRAAAMTFLARIRIMIAMRWLLPGLLCLAALPDAARADALGDLRNLLASAPSAPARFHVLASTAVRDDNDGKIEERSGAAQIDAEEGTQGLHLIYGSDLLRRFEAEENARAADARAPTPVLDALGELKTMVVHDLIAPAPRILRLLDRASARGESTETFEGRLTRRIQLDLAQEKLGTREAEYVKKYEGNLELWLDQDGLPVAARLHEHYAGRAYVFFRFESTHDEDLRFARVGGRLLVRSSRLHAQSSGTIGNFDRNTRLELTPLE
jgi:hypothetical protein